MKERKKRKPVLFWIVFVLTTLLSAALFELGKNTLWGWALLLLLLAGWILLRTRALAGLHPIATVIPLLTRVDTPIIVSRFKRLVALALPFESLQF